MASGRPSTYNDPIKDPLHTKFLRAKSQARYRGEEWELSSEEYLNFWLENENYLNMGRGRDQFVFTRLDLYGAWSVDNCAIVTKNEANKSRFLQIGLRR